MSKSDVQMLAGIQRAELLGYRLAEVAASDEIMERAYDSGETGVLERAEAMYKDLALLDLDNTDSVRRFLAEHFDVDVGGLSRDQMAACAKTFAAQLKSGKAACQPAGV